jgi:hypothetical protein
MRQKRVQQQRAMGIPMRGTIEMVVRDARTRKPIRRQAIRNKITFLAADVLVELIAQRATDPTALGDAIYSMRMGTSTNQPSRSDINLGAFVFGVALGDVGKVTIAQGEISFIATLESGDANGHTLTEAGLFTGGTAFSTSDTPGTTPGTTRLFAHQVYPGIAKSSAIVIDYSWTISFTATP